MYADMEYAEEFMKGQLYAQAWQRASSQQKVAALTMATQRIDIMKKAHPLGSRISEITETNTDIKDACCYEALALLDRGDSERTKAIRDGVTSFSAGKFSESYNKIVGYASINKYLLSAEAYNLLAPYLERRGCHPIV